MNALETWIKRQFSTQRRVTCVISTAEMDRSRGLKAAKRQGHKEEVFLCAMKAASDSIFSKRAEETGTQAWKLTWKTRGGVGGAGGRAGGGAGG